MNGQIRVVVWVLVAGMSACTIGPASEKAEQPFVSDFTIRPDDLATTGRHPFFILEPGYFIVLEEGSEQVKIVVTNQTKVVAGVETRVVEERESKRGKLVEISRNYFAINKKTGDVFYFGEDVDDYKDGKIVGHESAWIAGENGAKPGLIMPGKPAVGARYQQEFAPGQAMDRAEIVDLAATIRTPAGTFENCLRVKETNPLEPGKVELKHYAPGVGIVQDGGARLVKFGKE